MNKPKNITVMGRRWFNRGPGNTYHSVVVAADGVTVATVPFAYGYGSMYLQTAADVAEAAGLMPGREHHVNGGAESLRWYCRRNGITFSDDVCDVYARRDLHNGGR